MSGENSEPKYANFLCFVVSVQTNKLMSRRGGIGYSKSQMETHNLIKSLHDNGLGYRRIAKMFNKWEIQTPRGNTFSKGSISSILKRKQQRERRTEYEKTRTSIF